ncbi:MAG: carbamoyl-phosphate synthase (glutamine-hydrolyzing) large subunit [Candidatus Diapherotrites archaeon]|nr:carbamoyl-phosphate synthase (glutamine-hydrolyzing) large subunit [Candidatus Diapherotrites archaeon]
MTLKSKITKPKKVLILGSGALKIGQAGEFDYSGSQCLKALKEEGIQTVLINPNIATIQTSHELANEIYFLPVTCDFVEKVIEKEKPDAIMLAFGGQTALNCGIELFKKGILKKHNVQVLGTQVQTIIDTEDRELFKKKLAEIQVDMPKSIACETLNESLKAAEKIGYPVLIRGAFALGGEGSGLANTKTELEGLVGKALTISPQILVEEYLKGWKEIEYEVVRDQYGNCITVCNMENFDPMGIHTGESIVVAPSQTLSNGEYHLLRTIAIRTIRHLGIVGECNIQYALNPTKKEYRVIEVNARLSRSSALASKATGYPLAFIAAKLALGKSLLELKNSVTQKTTAFFEPALDYCVVKFPRWDLEKFQKVSKYLGSEMKSVGEVMAIGRTFEEAIQKAIRMLDLNIEGFTEHSFEFKDVEQELKHPTDKRFFAIYQALDKGLSPKKIHELTGIDSWFLHRLNHIFDVKNKLEQYPLTKDLLLEAKKTGFSDKGIAVTVKKKGQEISQLRKKWKIQPVVKQIDTLAAEWPAKTNYLYLTYHGIKDDIVFKQKKNVIVIGSGPYRIGSSVEFDWCSVNAVNTLNKTGYTTTLINFNPETVSTDYDICDRLYFEELSFERLLDIYEKEKPLGLILSTGGQIANNLAPYCKQFGLKVLGTQPQNIDLAENRHKFSALCDDLKIGQPEWSELVTEKQAVEFSDKVGFPVLVRPSYVLSGQAMRVAFNETDLQEYLKTAVQVSKKYPVTISKFIINAKEIEVDAVAQNGKVLCYAVTEHVENAGVHSGDATIVMPAQKIYIQTANEALNITGQLAKALKITGPFNVQFLAKNNKVKVIECNLRASRSFPFVSKVTGSNFIEVAVKAIMKQKQKLKQISPFELNHVGIKAPQFSFSRLRGADPVLSVEMASTGEVACLGTDISDAFLKSIIATGFKLPKKNILISISGDKNRIKLLEQLKHLKKQGFVLYGTEHTAEFYSSQKIPVKMVHKLHEKKEPNIGTYLREKKIDLVVCVPENVTPKELLDEFEIRRIAVDFGVPLITNIQLAKLFFNSLTRMSSKEFEIQPWSYYLKNMKK